jgi:peptidoglycan LD-endopeptidase CwlK
MGYSLGLRSKMRLRGVHPDLVKVVERAIQITEVDFTVMEGLRTVARQRELLKQGATRTMNSRHITGHAVDLGALVGGAVRWDWPLYHKIAAAMKQAAGELGIKIEAGADWKKFPDGPHFQLGWKDYPR